MGSIVETLPPFELDERRVPTSADIKASPFPPTLATAPSDPGAVAEAVAKKLNDALASRDADALAALFLPEGYWKDHLCLAWEMQTLNGRDAIKSFFSTVSVDSLKSISLDLSQPFRVPQVAPMDAHGQVKCLQFFITVDAGATGTGRGLVRLTELGGEWLVSVMYTCLEQIRGHEELVRHRRPRGVVHQGVQNGPNWRERREAAMSMEGVEPVVLVVGAGQAGLSAAARLKMLGVETLVVDKNPRVGDSWRNRYHQLVLHDPVWYDHLPYIPFPATWPVFTPKDQAADFLEMYARLLELNVWTATTLLSSSWDDGTRTWTVTLEKQRPDGTRETRMLHPRHIVQATGHSGKKNLPAIKGMESFRGDALCHSSEFPGAARFSEPKKAVVVGSCNSGHDIAHDFYSQGWDVTMVQRSSTCVISSDAMMAIGLGGLYAEDGPAVEDADVWVNSIPAPLFKTLQQGVAQLENKMDEATLRGLMKAGFKVDMGPGGAGLLNKYFQRGGGYYIDVGASQLIVDGKIKIKQGTEVTEVLEKGLRFADGSELEADAVVFATGYQNMRSATRDVFGDEVADRVNDAWGYDEQGEIRGVWKKSGHPGLWLAGGNLAMCRYFSRCLALQIKGVELGLNKG